MYCTHLAELLFNYILDVAATSSAWSWNKSRIFYYNISASQSVKVPSKLVQPYGRLTDTSTYKKNVCKLSYILSCFYMHLAKNLYFTLQTEYTKKVFIYKDTVTQHPVSDISCTLIHILSITSYFYCNSYIFLHISSDNDLLLRLCQ